MFDSVFQGTPTSLVQSGGSVQSGFDTENGQIYFRTQNSAGWQLASTPYPTLMYDGDSITIGDGTSGKPASAWIGPLLKRQWNIKNAAISGQTAAVCLSLAPNHVDSFLVRPCSLSVSIIWAGTNDLQHGVIPSDVWGYLVSYSSCRKSSGWNKTYVMTCISRTNVLDATRDVFNALIRNNWQSSGFDGLIDSAATALGDNGACDNPVLFQADKIHPTVSAQQTIIAPLEASVINAIQQ